MAGALVLRVKGEGASLWWRDHTQERWDFSTGEHGQMSKRSLGRTYGTWRRSTTTVSLNGRHPLGQKQRRSS